MKTIDIDVGGTFTDLVLTWDDERVVAKSPTTPFDLSVGFVNVLHAGAAELGQPLAEILPQVEIVRYSTTVAMNRLIERKGPRLGLITTEGHEDAILIGRGAQWTDGTRISERRNLAVQRKPAPLVERDMIVGVAERVDSTGTIIARWMTTTSAPSCATWSTAARAPSPCRCSGPLPTPSTSGRCGGSSARSTRAITSATCR